MARQFDIFSGDLQAMSAKNYYVCPVCGYRMMEPPSDFNTCVSCGTEFGLHDSGRSYADLRKEWMSAGAPWSGHNIPAPDNWNPYVQMLNAHLIDITVGAEADLKITIESPSAECATVQMGPTSRVL
jgi:DNA-directed RNA polymerase subunit RPC12/RpoP